MCQVLNAWQPLAGLVHCNRAGHRTSISRLQAQQQQQQKRVTGTHKRGLVSVTIVQHSGGVSSHGITAAQPGTPQHDNVAACFTGQRQVCRSWQDCVSSMYAMFVQCDHARSSKIQSACPHVLHEICLRPGITLARYARACRTAHTPLRGTHMPLTSSSTSTDTWLPLLVPAAAAVAAAAAAERAGGADSSMEGRTLSSSTQ